MCTLLQLFTFANEHFDELTLLQIIKNIAVIREPWSSGYGRRLVFRRPWAPRVFTQGILQKGVNSMRKIK